MEDQPHLARSRTSSVAWDTALLFIRLFLAALFLFSGAAKLGLLGAIGNTPAEFATAVRKFEILHYDLVPYAAFIIPWTELVCGLGLLIGLASRGAAVLAQGLLLAFTLGMVIVIFRGLTVENCACFGGTLKENFGVVGQFLESEVGPVSIVRNLFLMGLALLIVLRGSGYLGLDWFMRRPAPAA